MTFNPMLGYLSDKANEKNIEAGIESAFVPPIPLSLSFLLSPGISPVLPVTGISDATIPVIQLEPVHQEVETFKAEPAIATVLPPLPFLLPLLPKETVLELVHDDLTEENLDITDSLFGESFVEAVSAVLGVPELPDLFSLIPKLPTPLILPGTTPVYQNPFSASAKNPFKASNSNYEIVLPAYANKRQIAIKESGIRVEDLPQEDLREIYYFLKGRMNGIIWRASTINDVDKRGEPRKEEEREESEWMFTGSAIHEAMETQGNSLKKLFHFGGLGEEPIKPESSLSKDHIDMMKEMIVNGKSSVEAYIKVKDNLSTKGFLPEWLAETFIFPCVAEREKLTKVLETVQLRYDDFVAGNLEHDDLSEDEQTITTSKLLDKKLLTDVKTAEKEMKAVKDSEEFKSVSKLAKAALTEYEKFKDELPKFEKYLKEIDVFDLRKNQVREKAKVVEDSVVLDDLSFTTTKGFRIYETVAKTYGALANSKEAFDVYHPYKISSNKFECFSEYVILYDYTLPNGKKVPFMSMIDRYIIDHTTKIAWVIDLKTYGKQGNFIHVNYKDHAYWRAMAVYYEAIRVDLERRGHSDYKIQCSILPISIVSLEVGVFGIPLLNLSKEEIRMGTNGGMMKFQGSVFNDQKEVCTAMSEKLVQHFIETDQISANSPEFYCRGWKRIVEDFEMRKVPAMAAMQMAEQK